MAADYIVWRKWLGGTYAQSAYNTWRTSFGQSAGNSAALPSAELLSAAVLVPTTSTLMILAAAGWRIRRRRTTKKVPSTR